MQRRILKEVARGVDPDDLPRVLGMSESAVRWHICEINRRTGRYRMLLAVRDALQAALR